jgi:cytochrome c-type biogenesis protein CcmH
VKPAFFIAAAAMIVVALALLLLPLLRHGRRQGPSRRVFALALSIAFVLPLAAAGLYLLVGTPAALNGVPSQDQVTMNIDQAVHKLRAHLAEHPDDAQGWMLLAQTATAMQQPDEARDAYDRVLKLSPNDTAAMVGWAEADAMLRADHRIQGRARALLEQAVKLEPDNQRGLWLLGISQFQDGSYAEAAATWRVLQPQLEPGSKVAQAVAGQIAMADARASGKPAGTASVAPPAGTAAPSEVATSDSPTLTVQVSLAPALKDKLAAGDTLFVYARAEHGPPMPLAVARLDASRLPATVTLTDAMGMLPQMKLSSARRVFVGARVSKSGQAIAQSGDLEGDAGVVPVDGKTPVKIVIDKIHG